VEPARHLAKLPADKLLAVPGPSFLVIEAPRPYDKVGSFTHGGTFRSDLGDPADLARHLAEPERLRRRSPLWARIF